MTAFEITGFASSSGPLTKRISLAADGSLISDGSACVMARGSAQRLQFASFEDFATHIGRLPSNEAIALGSLRDGLPDRVEVATAAKIASLNGHAPSGLISRTANYIAYRPQQTAAVLLDYDTKEMPPAVAARIKEAGGFWPALVSVVPALEHAARAVRGSTSSGIVRDDTGESLKGSDGVHVYVHVTDGADTERFLKTLHDRCWLAGLGWMMVGAGGQFLERSIVDRMVGAGERLVFEGAPVLEKPLSQRSRVPELLGTEVIDTASACRTFTQVETSELQRLKGTERHRLAPAATKERTRFVTEHAARLAAKPGGSLGRARYAVERLCEKGILLPTVELVFDDAELGTVTVGDVLADPDRFIGATLADPLEGIAYGRCKAKVMQNADLSPFVNSFAHGHAVYDLKLDAAAVEEAVKKVDPADAHEELARRLLQADITTADEKKLKLLAGEMSGVKPKEINDTVKSARLEKARADREDAENRASAMRTDGRVRLTAPAVDNERLPILRAIDEVFCGVREPEPPMRNLEGVPTEVRVRAPTHLHALASTGSNQDEPAGTSRLPAPEMPLLSAHDSTTLAHVVERHIEFVKTTKFGPVPVALPPIFADHYMAYRDSALPLVGAVVTAPLVLSDGTLLAPNGLDRDRRIVFRIPPEMRRHLPQPNDPVPTAKEAREAMAFLTDDWLVDVATDFAGKCVLVAMAMTILQRTLLPQRPAFFVVAGKRGGGKTTALTMVNYLVTGKAAAAAAWSFSEEERRKALLAYLVEGPPAIVFDNIPLGSLISCKTIEGILTASEYSDRILNHTAISTVPAHTVLSFTGNNVAPRGDLASRSLVARLDVDRPDPENRPFRHIDPVAWTLANRGKLLRALYIVMLANPQLKANAPQKTRFKDWWHLVGSAIEHAAHEMVEHQRNSADLPIVRATQIDIVKLFALVEVDDEDQSDLADVLRILDAVFHPVGKQDARFKAKDVAAAITTAAHAGEVIKEAGVLKAFFASADKDERDAIGSKIVGRKLASILDAPITVDDKAKDGIRKCGCPAAKDECARHRVLKLARKAQTGSQVRTAEFHIQTITENYPNCRDARNNVASGADDISAAAEMMFPGGDISSDGGSASRASDTSRPCAPGWGDVSPSGDISQPEPYLAEYDEGAEAMFPN